MFSCKKSPTRPSIVRTFKYKHKEAQEEEEEEEEGASRGQSMSSCDLHTLIKSRWRTRTRTRTRTGGRGTLAAPVTSTTTTTTGCLLLLALLLSTHLQHSLAFCPFKCHCNDTQLSANCTQVQSLTFVPMTLNPLLKSLTLNGLPMTELANSLSIYNKLEYLNLNSNQLRQIKYENLNLRSAPNQMRFSLNNNNNNSKQSTTLKQTLDRLHLAPMDNSNLSGGAQSDQSGHQASQHSLVELHLSDNRIELLGDWSQSASSSLDDDSELGADQPQVHLRASQLERMAPFLWLNKLLRLDLSGNRLQRLNKHTFLGLSSLRYLDLSRNQLSHLDKLALVGLVELRELSLAQNKLANQLASLSLTLCRMPASSLLKLNLNMNQATNKHPNNQNNLNNLNNQNNNLFLPNQMFLCAANLQELHLNSLNLNYIQVNAFDNMKQLKLLNLSSNPLELVPTESFQFQVDTFNNQQREELQLKSEQSGQKSNSLASSLLELDLSDTLIEFVNVNSFGPLRRLEKLHMNSMSRLVSFDLGSLISNTRHLKQLQLRDNKRLQSFYSSIWFHKRERIHFEALEQLDLFNANQLHDLPLEQMLATASPGQHLQQQNQQRPPVRLDLSFANNLNCSSCSLAWLIRQTQQLIHQIDQRPSANQLAGWNPIPFDPYQSYLFRPSPIESHQQHHNHNDHHQSNLVSLEATQVATLGCSWPVQAPLLQLISSHHLLAHCPIKSLQDDWQTGGNVSRPQQNKTSVTSMSRPDDDDNNNNSNLSPVSLVLGSLICLVLLLLIVKLTLLFFEPQLNNNNNKRRPTTGRHLLMMWPPSFSAPTSTTCTSSPLGSPASSCALSAASSAGQVTCFNDYSALPKQHQQRTLWANSGQHHSNLMLQPKQQQQRPLALENHHSQMFVTNNNNNNNNKSMLAGEEFAAARRGNLFSRFVGHLRMFGAPPRGDREEAAAVVVCSEGQTSGGRRWPLNVQQQQTNNNSNDYWSSLSSQRPEQQQQWHQTGDSNHSSRRPRSNFVASNNNDDDDDDDDQTMTRISSGQATQFISKVNWRQAAGVDANRKPRNNNDKRQTLIDYSGGGQEEAEEEKEELAASGRGGRAPEETRTCRVAAISAASRLANLADDDDDRDDNGQQIYEQPAELFEAKSKRALQSEESPETGAHFVQRQLADQHLNELHYVTLDGPIKQPGGGGGGGAGKLAPANAASARQTPGQAAKGPMLVDRFGIICVANNLNGHSFSLNGDNQRLAGRRQEGQARREEDGQQEYDIIARRNGRRQRAGGAQDVTVDVASGRLVSFGQQMESVDSARLSMLLNVGKYDANHNNHGKGNNGNSNNINNNNNNNNGGAGQADNYVINGTRPRETTTTTTTTSEANFESLAVGVTCPAATTTTTSAASLTSFAVRRAPPSKPKGARRQLATNDNSIMICQQDGRASLAPATRPTEAEQTKPTAIGLMNGGRRDEKEEEEKDDYYSYIEFCDGPQMGPRSSAKQTIKTTSPGGGLNETKRTNRANNNNNNNNNAQIYSNQFYYYSAGGAN